MRERCLSQLLSSQVFDLTLVRHSLVLKRKGKSRCTKMSSRYNSQIRVHQGDDFITGRVDALPVVIRVRLRDQDHGLFSISYQRKASWIPFLRT